MSRQGKIYVDDTPRLDTSWGAPYALVEPIATGMCGGTIGNIGSHGSMGSGSSLVFDGNGSPYSLEQPAACSVYSGHLSLRCYVERLASTRSVVDNPDNYETFVEALRDVGLLHTATTPTMDEVQSLIGEALDRGLLQLQPHFTDLRSLYDVDPCFNPEPLLTELPWEGELLQCTEEQEEEEEEEEEDIYLIVVGDRAVKGTVGAAYHYSLELWRARPANIPIGTNFDRSEFEQQYTGSQFVEGVELLRESGWRVYEYEDRFIDAFDGWDETDVAISVISYAPQSTEVMPIISGDKATISARWSEALAAAKSYGFAEQDGFDGAFQHWPNSRYEIYTFDDVNNSNTFVRWLVDEIGLTMNEMDGAHPGRMSPVVEEDYQYSATPWRETENAPPEPTAPPR